MGTTVAMNMTLYRCRTIDNASFHDFANPLSLFLLSTDTIVEGAGKWRSPAPPALLRQFLKLIP